MSLRLSASFLEIIIKKKSQNQICVLSLVDILGNLCTNLLALLVSLPSFPPLLLFLFLGWSIFLLASFIFLTVTEQCEKKVEVFLVSYGCLLSGCHGGERKTQHKSLAHLVKWTQISLVSGVPGEILKHDKLSQGSLAAEEDLTVTGKSWKNSEEAAVSP